MISSLSELPSRERAKADNKSYESNQEAYQILPTLRITGDDKEKLKQLKELKKKESSYERCKQQIDLLRSKQAKQTLKVEEVQKLADLEEQFKTKNPLTDTEQQEKENLSEAIGRKVEAYQKESEQELALSPKKEAFEGFHSIEEELDELETESTEHIPKYGVIALEEIRILVHRLFGGHSVLRTLFEEKMVLRYDNANGVPPPPGEPIKVGGNGGATVKKESINGKPKFAVTIDDATFLKEKTYQDKSGKERVRIEADFVSAAFTIGKAILTAAFDDEALNELSAGMKNSKGLRDSKAPFPESLLERHASEQFAQHKPKDDREKALDYLAFFLLDPDQAKNVDKELAGLANKMLKKVNPENMRKGNDTISIRQTAPNYEFLYKNYDPTKREKNTVGKAGEWLANTNTGFYSRIGAGSIFGITGLTLLGPAGWLGTAAAAVGGAYIGAAARAPRHWIRTVQAVFQERYDFYYELAVSEQDNKEVTRLNAREEGGGNRAKRLRFLLAAEDEEGVRRVLMSISGSGDFNLWHAYLYLYHFDAKFRATGGQEITQQGYNFVERMHRLANKAKRVGTVIGMYAHSVDSYGRHIYRLRDYNAYEGSVWEQWSQRGDREAQQSGPEVFNMMKDGNRFLTLDERYGENLEDPNSLGWNVADLGDLRGVIGEQKAKEFFSFLHNDWQGDRDYLLKFNACEKTAIQRMATIDKSKFPSEYTRESARDAYEHYSEFIGARPSKLDAKDAAAKQKIQKKSAQDIVEDDSIDEDTLDRIDQQLIDDKYETKFANTDGYKYHPTHLTMRGQLIDELEHRKQDLSILSQKSEISEPMRYELSRLVDFTKDELQGKVRMSRETDKERYNEIQNHIDALVLHERTDEKQRFAVQDWLTKVTEIAPQARVLDRFRESLQEIEKPYEDAFMRSKNDDRLRQTTKDYKDLKAIMLEAAEATDSSVPVLRDKAKAIIDRIKLRISPSIQLEDQAIQQPVVQTADTLHISLESVVKQVGTLLEEHTPSTEKELSKVKLILADTRQALRMKREGSTISEEMMEQERKVRVDLLKRLSAVPESIKNSQADFSDHEIYEQAKLAFLAVRRAQREEERKKSKEEKENEQQESRKKDNKKRGRN